MQAGDLRHRITIAAEVETADGRGGFAVTTQTLWSRIPALVEPLSGRELQAAMQIDPRLRYRVSARWLPGVKAEQLVTYHAFDGDRALEIVGPPLIDEKARAMQLMCGEAQT